MSVNGFKNPGGLPGFIKSPFSPKKSDLPFYIGTSPGTVSPETVPAIRTITQGAAADEYHGTIAADMNRLRALDIKAAASSSAGGSPASASYASGQAAGHSGSGNGGGLTYVENAAPPGYNKNWKGGLSADENAPEALPASALPSITASAAAAGARKVKGPDTLDRSGNFCRYCCRVIRHSAV